MLEQKGIQGKNKTSIIIATAAIIISLIACVVVLCSLIKAQNMLVAIESDNESDRQPDIEEELIEELSEESKTFAIDKYTFEYPGDWLSGEIVVNETPSFTRYYANFSDEQGNVLAQISCPPPETGFEAWTFESYSHSQVINNDVYRYHLSAGDPVESTDGIGWMYLIGMGTIENLNQLHPTGSFDCFLSTTTTWASEQDYDDFEMMYNSIEVVE